MSRLLPLAMADSGTQPFGLNVLTRHACAIVGDSDARRITIAQGLEFHDRLGKHQRHRRS